MGCVHFHCVAENCSCAARFGSYGHEQCGCDVCEHNHMEEDVEVCDIKGELGRDVDLDYEYMEDFFDG